jgi:hypothetical protein
VTEATTTAVDLPHRDRPRRDPGISFIEVLVAIVLLGTVIVGVLAAVRTTIIGSTTERDHAKAHQWLQSAIGVIESYDFADCNLLVDVTGESVRAVYQAAIEHPVTGAKQPEGFAGAVIAVGVPRVWDGMRFVDFESQTVCYDQYLLRQQLVELTVTGPDGRIIESVEVVKRDQVSH